MTLAAAAAAAVVHFAKDEASGNALDSIGSRDLTDNNTVGSTTGKFGNARLFNGSDEFFSRASEATFVFGNENWSFSVWSKHTDNNASYGIFGKFDNSDEYALYYSQGADRFRFDATPGSVIANTFGSPPQDTWALLCGGYDADNDEYWLSINGGAKDTFSSTSGITGNATNPFLVGAIRSNPLFPFKGPIDDLVLMRGYVLSDQDIDDIWDGGTGVAFEDWDGGGVTTLTADSGTFTITGTAASLEYNRLASAVSGTYAVTGTAANLEYHHVLSAASGTFTITGTAATLRKEVILDAEAGSYAVTGTAANLEYHHVLSAASGTYTVSGTDATLIKVGDYELDVDPGSYAITGTAASLEYNRLVSAASGTFTVSGTAASLERHRLLSCVAGAFAVTGTAATLTKLGQATLVGRWSDVIKVHGSHGRIACHGSQGRIIVS